MKIPGVFLLSASLVASLSAAAQTTVVATDLQLDVGTKRTYLTHQGSITVVNGLIMSTGGPNHWNFSAGVSDETYKYEILPAANSPFGAPFPGASLAEVLTVGSVGEYGWTYFNLTPEGRELHGFHELVSNPSFPVIQFSSTMVDYPATISYLDQWTDQTSYVTSVDLVGTQVPVDVNVTITSFVDSHGTMTLPNLGTVEVLRINELSLFDSVANIGATPVPLGQSYSRSYLWVSKEYGRVAQITSEGGTVIPPAEFDVASRFLRLSEFIPATPMPVLRSVDHDPGSATVSVSSTSIAGQDYILEVSTNLVDWQEQGDPVRATGASVTLVDNLVPVPTGDRFYRVRHLP